MTLKPSADSIYSTGSVASISEVLNFLRIHSSVLSWHVFAEKKITLTVHFIVEQWFYVSFFCEKINGENMLMHTKKIWTLEIIATVF